MQTTLDLAASQQRLRAVGERENDINLYWKDVSYTVSTGTGKKILINSLSGHARSGQLTAVLGPSGSGKTTLFECLSKRRVADVRGDIWASSSGRHIADVRIVYSAQKDSLFSVLTVRESMIYAAELQRYCGRNIDVWSKCESKRNTSDENGDDEDEDEDDHDFSASNNRHGCLKVDEIIQQLGLYQCADVRVANCSGGQRRRLSIALELIFSPNVMLLDEPTTGLDSVSSLQLVQLLKSLVRRHPVIVCASIHQPSATLFAHFDHVYMISSAGSCVYDGAREDLLTHMNRFGLQCPIFHNIADFALEIASGIHGEAVVHELAAAAQQRQSAAIIVDDPERYRVQINAEQSMSKRFVADQLLSARTLMRRAAIIFYREPFDFAFRIMGLAILLSVRLVLTNEETMIGNDCFNSTKFARKIISMGSDPENFRITALLSRDIILIIASIMFASMISLIPALFLFPIELSIFEKEHSNRWYTQWSYYMGKSVADIPPMLCFPIVGAIATYAFIDQPPGWWRPLAYIGVAILAALLSHSIGLLVSMFFVNNTTAAVVVGSIIFVPLFIFSGFIFPIHKLPSYVRPFTNLSVYKLAIESTLIIFYGYNRCGGKQLRLTLNDFADMIPLHFAGNVSECIASQTSLPTLEYIFDAYNREIGSINHSIILNRLHLEDHHLILHCSLMVAYIVLFRVVSYYVLKWKTAAN